MAILFKKGNGSKLLSKLEHEQISNPSKGLNKKLIMHGDGVKVMSVDGNYVREHYYPDFVVAGHHYVSKDYAQIPKNEVWVEEAYANNPEDPSERTARDAAIIHELNERIEMKLGHKPYLKAHKDSNKREMRFERKEGY